MCIPFSTISYDQATNIYRLFLGFSNLDKISDGKTDGRRHPHLGTHAPHHHTYASTGQGRDRACADCALDTLLHGFSFLRFAVYVAESTWEWSALCGAVPLDFLTYRPRLLSRPPLP